MLSHCRENLELIEKLGIPEEGKTPLAFTTRFPQSYWAQFRLITHRNFVSYYRNSSYNCTRFVFGLILGFLFGSSLWNIGTKRYLNLPAPLLSNETMLIKACGTSKNLQSRDLSPRYVHLGV